MKYLNGVLMNLGLNVVGDVGSSVGRDPSALEKSKGPAQDFGKKLVRSIRRNQIS